MFMYNNTSVQCCTHYAEVLHLVLHCVILSMLLPTQNIAAFEAGSFLPLPSREAIKRSIGKGGNGTISIVYFKGVEFAVKRVSNTSWCTYILQGSM